MTLEQLLRKVEEGFLRPDGRRVAEAKDRARRLIAALDAAPDAWMYRVLRDEHHGSLSRGTGIRDFKDVDFLVVLSRSALKTSAGGDRSPRDTVHRMARRLERSRQGLVTMGHVEVRPQDHSVGVTYPASGYRIDLVPALVSGGYGWRLVPEKSTNAWVRSNPSKHVEILDQAKARSPGALIAIRLLKGWSRARGYNAPLPSFAIECLVIQRVLASGGTVSEIVSGVFSEIAGRDKRARLDLGSTRSADPPPVRVPTVVMERNITHELDAAHRRRIIEACRVAEERLEDIRSKLRCGSDGPALTAARDLFVGHRWC